MALIGVVSIVLALVTAGLVLTLLGQTLNALLLAGLALALGVVVDDAITGVENVWRRLRERRGEGGRDSIRQTVIDASAELRGPLAYATVIVLLTVIPILAIGGRPGALLEPLAFAFIAAVAASLLVALTVAPALASVLLRGSSLERRDAPLMRWLKNAYAGLLERTLRRPDRSFVAAGAVLLLGALLLAPLGLSLLPTFREPDVLVHLDAAPGTSHPEMARITTAASRELRSIVGVRNVGAHVGRAVMSDRIAGVSSGTLWVSLEPGVDYDATLGTIREALAGYPGLRQDVLTYSRERIRAIGALQDGETDVARSDDGVEVLTGGNRPLIVRLYGKDLAELNRKAQEVAGEITGVAGVLNPTITPQVQEPTLEIETNLALARRYGIKPGDVRRAAATLLAGLTVGSLFEGQKVFDVVVVGAPGTRHDPEGVREILIDAPSGGHVRLGDVADVRIVASPSVIRHEAASRYVDVSAEVRGRDAGAVRHDVEERLENAVALPLEHHFEIFAESTGQEIGAGRLLGVAIAAALAILLLLQVAFGSWRLASLFLLTLPVALVGGLVAAQISGGTLSVGSLAGLLLVLGLAVRSGLSLIGRLQALEREDGGARDRGLVLRAAQERLPGVVMTAAALGLATLPVIFRGYVPGHEIIRPMAIVVLGGLVTSTLSTLVLVPALYVRLAPRPRLHPPSEGQPVTV
jgi:Cu/Ag efflux pump CusA